jgi:hypothetical protein
MHVQAEQLHLSPASIGKINRNTAHHELVYAIFAITQSWSSHCHLTFKLRVPITISPGIRYKYEVLVDIRTIRENSIFLTCTYQFNNTQLQKHTLTSLRPNTDTLPTLETTGPYHIPSSWNSRVIGWQHGRQDTSVVCCCHLYASYMN